MANLPVPSNSPDIGECIYCGASGSELTKEHAIPYGLNGPWTLLRASCLECADITHRFERDTLRGLLSSVRTVLALQTRNPKRRAKNLALVLEEQGARRTIQVPTNEFPLYLPAPKFLAPGCLTGAPKAAGISTAHIDFIHLSGPTLEDVTKKYAVDFAGARLDFSPTDFARTLAKIAFTAAVYVLGLAPFSRTPIRQVILGKELSIGHWVGSWEGAPVNEARGLHQMKVMAIGTDIHVVLRLFAQFGAPEYHVVLGAADPEFANSAAWPWK